MNAGQITTPIPYILRPRRRQSALPLLAWVLSASHRKAAAAGHARKIDHENKSQKTKTT